MAAGGSPWRRQAASRSSTTIPSAVLVVGTDGRVRLMSEPALRLSVPVGVPGTLAGDAGEPGAAAGEPLTAGGRGAGGAVVALHDISEIRRLERARRDLIANVSHALKTPIAVIRGFAETLREGALERPEGRDLLQRIETESDRIAALVDRLLLLARLEQPDFEPVRRPVALGPLLEEMVEDRRPLAARAGVTRTTRLAGESLQVEADPDLLRHAVGNLPDNAIRHTPTGGEVLVAAEDTRDAVRVEVADTAPGVPPEHRRRAFQRFYRVDPGRSRAAGGTGLDLAIVKHVAQVHGGRVGVDDRPGGGAPFWLAQRLRPGNRRCRGSRWAPQRVTIPSAAGSQMVRSSSMVKASTQSCAGRSPPALKRRSRKCPPAPRAASRPPAAWSCAWHSPSPAGLPAVCL